MRIDDGILPCSVFRYVDEALPRPSGMSVYSLIGLDGSRLITRKDPSLSGLFEDRLLRGKGGFLDTGGDGERLLMRRLVSIDT